MEFKLIVFKQNISQCINKNININRMYVNTCKYEHLKACLKIFSGKFLCWRSVGSMLSNQRKNILYANFYIGPTLVQCSRAN